MKKESRNLTRYLGLFPVLAFIVLIIVYGFLYPSAKVTEPPYLFPILNTVFLFVVSCIVAYVSLRSYLASGSSPILLLGAGVLVFGTGSFASGWTISRFGVNVSATMHNGPLLLAAIFHIAGVIASAKEEPPETDPVQRRWKLTAAYITAPVFVFSLFFLTINGIMPPFFVSGSGWSPLRQAIMASAFVLFVYSSSYMMTRFLWKKNSYLYWYSLALTLLSIMAAGFYIQPAVGSPVGWIGRGAQYAAGIYFMVAVLSARREARMRGVSMDETVAELFLSPGFYWQDILKTALSGFWIVDTQGRFLEVNETCCRILGYTRAELLTMTIADVEAADSPSNVLRHIKTLGEKKTDHFLSQLRRKDGATIDVGLNATYLDIGEGQVTAFFQDITERKRAEDALQAAHDRAEWLARFPEENPNPVMRAAADEHVLYCNPASAKVPGWTCGAGQPLPDPLLPLFRQAMAGGREIQQDVETDARFYTVWVTPFPEANYANIYGRDITERKRAEEELKRLNRTLKAISDSSQAMLRSATEQEYLEEICRIVMEDCGHAMVWIGYADDNEDKTVRPVAHAGFEEGYLEMLNVTWADTERGQGPTGTAIRTGVPSTCRNILTDPLFTPWREQAIKRGFHLPSSFRF